MNLTVDANRVLIGGRNVIGSDKENCSEVLSFVLQDSSLWSYLAFVEFRTEDGKTYTSEALPVSSTDGTFSYVLPNGLMATGCLAVQVVLRNSDGTYVYKSEERLFSVKPSVNASSDIALNYPDRLVTGVKGNAEESYRIGNVNLTCESIGTYDKTTIDSHIASAVVQAINGSY